MLSSLHNLIHYEAMVPPPYSYQFGMEVPLPSRALLRTLIIRNLRLPESICMFLSEQPLIEKLVLDVTNAGNINLIRGLIKIDPSFLPKLRILACNVIAAGLLVPGRPVVAYCCTSGAFRSSFPSSPSVISLHLAGDVGRNIAKVAGSFPNLRVACMCPDMVSLVSIHIPLRRPDRLIGPLGLYPSLGQTRVFQNHVGDQLRLDKSTNLEAFRCIASSARRRVDSQRGLTVKGEVVS